MKVGDKVVVQSLARYNGFWVKVLTVTKVGRKYFELEGWMRQRFIIETLEPESDGYSPRYKLWSIPLAWYLEQKEEILYKAITKVFVGLQYGARPKLRLSQLEAIAKILSIDVVSLLSQVNEQYLALRREYYGLNLDSGALGGIGEADGGGHIEASTTSGE